MAHARLPSACGDGAGTTRTTSAKARESWASALEKANTYYGVRRAERKREEDGEATNRKNAI